MKLQQLTFVMILCSLISGCKVTAYYQQPKAAVVEASTLNKKALETAIHQLLKVSSVKLADDAFIKNNFVVVERPQFKSSDGHVINGRSLEKPIKVFLYKSGNDCFIKTKDKELLLDTVECKVITPQ